VLYKCAVDKLCRVGDNHSYGAVCGVESQKTDEASSPDSSPAVMWSRQMRRVKEVQEEIINAMIEVEAIVIKGGQT
jgi:hypothetical protein